MDANTSIQAIQQAKPYQEKRLEKMGIKKVKDLLFHFPFRYEDYSEIVQIENILPNNPCTIKGVVEEISSRTSFRNRKLKIIEAYISDGTASIKTVWFNQYYIEKTLREGSEIYLAGKASIKDMEMFLSNPIHEIPNKKQKPIHTARIIPIYPETQGVTSRWFRYAIHNTLEKTKLQETLPENIRKENGFEDINKSLWQIHFPLSLEDAEKAKERFEFEEIYYIQLAALYAKEKFKKNKAPKININLNLIQSFTKSLPFTLTDSQKKAIWQILQDTARPQAMNRLLEGDVGSGKTVVATAIALNTAKNNYQATIMAPTEILAEQHFKNISNLLKNTGLKVALYTKDNSSFVELGKNQVKKIKKDDLKKEIKEGNADIVIGTHALVQEDVEFKNAGFVVIDEQHRFGVAQRAALLRKNVKNKTPHLLSMTATPIPRSLALTIYGDLDITLLKENPANRKKIETQVIPPQERAKAYNFIKKEAKKGRQAFVVFPLVEESEKLALRSATQEYEKLSNNELKGFNVALIHGRMKQKDKDDVMKKFKEKKIDILIATSVVEVGIDVPNATVMLIEGADRFGLAQLHQFRGRVGRSDHQSYCLLISESSSQNVLRRLKAIKKAKNGFDLAEYDLRIRGAGDLYGIRQSGMPDIAMASLTNVELIEKARKTAQDTLDKDSALSKNKKLKERVLEIQKLMHFE